MLAVLSASVVTLTASINSLLPVLNLSPSGKGTIDVWTSGFLFSSKYLSFRIAYMVVKERTTKEASPPQTELSFYSPLIFKPGTEAPNKSNCLIALRMML